MREDLQSKLAAARAAAEKAGEQKHIQEEVNQEQENQVKIDHFTKLANSNIQLDEIGKEISAAKEQLSSARGVRHEEMQSNKSAMEELQSLYSETLQSVDNQEDHPLVLEIKGHLDEVAPTSGETFEGATEEAQAAISKLRDNKAKLAQLGIDIEGKSVDEINNLVSGRQRELHEEMIAFVRNNPELTSEEIDQIKQEIISGEVTAIDKRIHDRTFAPVLSNTSKKIGEANLKLLSEDLSKNTDPEYLKQVKRSITTNLLDNFSNSSGIEKYIKVVSENSELDALSTEAVKESIRQMILNYHQTKSGFKVRDGIYSYGVDNEKISKILKKIAVAEGHTVPMYEDGSGMTSEAGPVLAETLDEEKIEAFAEKIIAAATIEKQLQELPEREKQLQELEVAIKEKTQEQQRLLEDRPFAEIQLEGDLIEKKREALLKLQASLENGNEALSKAIDISVSYEGVRISLQFDKEKANAIQEKIKQIRKQLEESKAQAQSAYADAQKITNSDLTIFRGKKKSNEIAEQATKDSLRAATESLDNISNNPDILALNEQSEHNRRAYIAVTKPLEQQLQTLGITNLSAANGARLSEALQEKVQSDIQAAIARLEEKKSRQQSNNEKISQLADEIDALKEKLEPISKDDRTIVSFIQREQRRLLDEKARLFPVKKTQY